VEVGARRGDLVKRHRSQPDADPGGDRIAAIYARVSTDEQVKGTSLEAQVDRCEQAAVAAGCQAVEVFVDRGVSGALSSRPRLDALVRLVEDGCVQTVFITKLDRIARSLRHLLDLLELLERHHVSLVALDDPLDPSTASGRAMVQLRGVFAELERQLIRERTMDGQRCRVAAGGWPGGPGPYGYRAIDNTSGPGRVLAIDESEAAVVRLAYKLIAQDALTTGEAAAELDRLGTRPRRSPQWTHWNLRRLLLDGRGLSGQWPWRREGRDGRTGEDEVVVAIPAILSPEEHEHLRAVLATTTTHHDKWRSYLLSGRIVSPHGRCMQGVAGRGEQRWYQCPHRFRGQRPPGTDACDCGRLHASTIEAAVWDRVRTLLSDPAALVALAEELDLARGDHASGERAKLAELDAQIERLANQVADEYAALRDEGFDPATARAAIRKLDTAIVELRRQRADLLRFRTKNLAAVGLARQIRTLAGRAQELLANPDPGLQRKVLDLLDVRVEVLGWEVCVTCGGNGLLSRPGPRRRAVGPDNDRRGDLLICPDCTRTRQIPALRISGQIPSLLLASIDQRDAGGYELAGVVLPFETDFRVA
jgi:DNA invertase Pin-like site-specific DNA recombinase